MQFSHPAFEVGGSDLVPDFATSWADGFTPHEHSRIIKFFHAEETNEPFNPDARKLPNPHQIFQFSELLGDAIGLHMATFPKMSQYFYLPATENLGRLYSRIFSRDKNCTFRDFCRIVEPLGDFYGYEKS